MSETARLITESADRLFAEHVSRDVIDQVETGAWPAALWQAVSEAGYAEAWGDSGSESREMALAMAHRAGWHTLPLPLVETVIARHFLASHDIEAPTGPLSIGNPLLLEDVELVGNRLTGTARRVPFARHAAGMVTVIDGTLVFALSNTAKHGTNMAGEPRDDVTWQGTEVTIGGAIAADRFLAAGAYMRAAQICGALQRALAQATQYAGERKQFGRPLGKFQAIQHYLARIAGLTATAEGALARAVASPDNASIAAAKACASEAAGEVAALTHQIHGAIGFTREFPLHPVTRRLLSWREEFGAEAWWQEYLGGMIAAGGADGLWPLVTAEA